MSTDVRAGYTGTLQGFLEWLGQHLTYGRLRLGDPQPDEFDRPVRRLELVTGGYSDDEELLERVRSGLLGTAYWQSSHRGGLDVYLIPAHHLESGPGQSHRFWPADTCWVAPDEQEMAGTS